MEEAPKKKRGPKPKYENQTEHQQGAPKLITRLDPELLEWVRTEKPGELRSYIENLIRRDRQAKQRSEEGVELITRVDKDVLDFAKSRPEGLRKYVERLIRADRRSEEDVSS